MEGGEKKCLCVVFCLTRRSQVRRKNAFGASYSVEKSPSIKVHRVTDPLLLLNLRSTLFRLLVKWSV